MREIKFRGLDIFHCWHIGHLTQVLEGKDYGTYISNRIGRPLAYQVRDDSIGQYTGLKDKNGKDIYEGDIVRCPEDANPEEGLGSHFIAGVCWDFSGLCWHLYTEENGGISELSEFSDDIEVIGNIYENPELL